MISTEDKLIKYPAYILPDLGGKLIKATREGLKSFLINYPTTLSPLLSPVFYDFFEKEYSVWDEFDYYEMAGFSFFVISNSKCIDTSELKENWTYLFAYSNPIYPDYFALPLDKSDHPVTLLLVRDDKGKFCEDYLVEEGARLEVPIPPRDLVVDEKTADEEIKKSDLVTRGWFVIETEPSELAFYKRQSKINKFRILNELDIEQKATYSLLSFFYSHEQLKPFKNFIYYTRKMTDIIWSFAYEFSSSEELIYKLRKKFPEWFIPGDNLGASERKKHRARRKFIIDLLEYYEETKV